MAEDITEILSKAEVIRDETGESKNTAKRVGSVLVDICNAFKRVTDAVAGYLTVSKRVDWVEVLIRRQQDGEDVDRNTFEMTYDPSDGTVDIDAPEVCVRGKEIATLEDIEEKDFISPTSLWALLGYPSDEKINNSHLSMSKLEIGTFNKYGNEVYYTAYDPKRSEDCDITILCEDKYINTDIAIYGYGTGVLTIGFDGDAFIEDKGLLKKTGNAASATKLANSRTLWGQSFNGTQDVSGAMSGVTIINSHVALGDRHTVRLGDIYSLTASAIDAVAINYNNVASGQRSFCGGQDSKSTSYRSFAYGYQCDSGGIESFVIGRGNKTATDWQSVFGKYNNIESDKAFVIGNGTSDTTRRNAMTIDWHGNQTLQGGLSMNGVLSGARGEIKAVCEVLKNGQFTSTDNWSSNTGLSIDNNVGAVVKTNDNYGFDQRNPNIVAGHKYLILTDMYTSQLENVQYNILGWDASWANAISSRLGYLANSNRKWAVTTAIKDCALLRFYSADMATGETLYMTDAMVLDLTAMFGQGSEPTTATEFASRLGYASIEDAPYIPYGASELNNAVAFGGGAMFGGNIATTGDTFKLGKYTIKEQDGHLIATDGTNTTTIL